MVDQAIGFIVIALVVCALFVGLQFKLSNMPGKIAGLILPITVILAFVGSFIIKGQMMLATGVIFPIFIVTHFLSFSMLLIYLLERKEK